MVQRGSGANGRMRGTDDSAAREKLLQATRETLCEHGFVGASARAIATRAGVNPGLVFYYFGSVNDLLLAALDESNTARLDRYRGAIGEVSDVGGLLAVIVALNREDFDGGHVAMMAALTGGAAAIPGLGSAIAERVEPWIALTEATMKRVLAGTALADLIDLHAVAAAFVALFLGSELLAQLSGDRSNVNSLFAEASKLAQLFAATGAERPS